MPSGPNRQRCSAGVIGTAVIFVRIAADGFKEAAKAESSNATSRLAGEKVCALKFLSGTRTETAKKAAAARWG
jgi:hypothetical protein